jgi:hypothetical protein
VKMTDEPLIKKQLPIEEASINDIALT